MTHSKQLQNHLDVLRLTSREEVEHELVSYLVSKPQEFYKHGIYSLLTDGMTFQETMEVILMIKYF